MENCQTEEKCDAPQKEIFGEDFALLAITVTVAWTYAIINAVLFIA